MNLKKFIIFTIMFASFFFIQQENKTEASSLLVDGSSGSDVESIQQTLYHLGYLDVNPTGYYGSLTAEAVRQFQTDFNMSIDGVVGTNTQQKLSDVEKMARVVHGEARGESYEGQVAVAAVIYNRVEDSGFPSTVHDVIFQRNAFTAVADGQYDLTPDSNAYQAVKDAQLGWDPSSGSTYYYNPEIATSSWIFTREKTLKIGSHLFAE
nr:cell wall hydrolase [Alteribacter populi]